LWGLEGVARAGRPRTPWGRAPFASPEQHRGEGLVDSRDAVWSAAPSAFPRFARWERWAGAPMCAGT
ncbi:hypothetical protein ACFV4I_25885, partial [Nocardiopsis alba]|uniref:hypothetical protein n=1 Tax=Nocardiopsis alba TaxID=53437 RepID=UPI0036596E87